MRPQDQKAIITKKINKYCKTNNKVLKVAFDCISLMSETAKGTYYRKDGSAILIIDPKKKYVRFHEVDYSYDQEVSVKTFSDYIVLNTLYESFITQLGL